MLTAAAESGDAEGCRALVEVFLPAIVSLAKAPFGSGRVERRELVQEGVAGLLLAARRYDPSLSTPFWAYAAFWVRKAMQELVAELARPVALSDRAVRGLAALRAARADHLQAQGREATDEDLCRATGFTPDQLESLRAAERTPRSLEELFGKDEAGVTVGDTISDPAAEAAYDHVLDDLAIRGVQDLTEQLGERERVVLRAHYGLGEPPRTLTEIGVALGLTAERARQIEHGALGKLREALAEPARAVAGAT